MIQDIYPHKLDNEYLVNIDIKDNDYIFQYTDNSLLLKAVGNEFEFPRKKDFPEISNDTERIFLFSLDDTPCFLVWEKLDPDNADIYYHDIGFFRKIQQQEVAWASLVGYHLMNWYLQNRYCGKCGAKTQHKLDERALICPDCNTTVFPKISPAVIAAIICKDKILLARNHRFPGSWYSLIAGYVDIGESFEETLVREVKEEVGLDIRNIRYYKSQPWPLSGSVMIGFIAEADDKQPIVIDDKEIAEAAWFARGKLPEHPSNISIAGEMINKFKKGEL